MVDESYDPHARMHESFPRVDSGSTKMAGDVIPIPGERSPGSPSATFGVDPEAVPYATGQKTDPKVHSIGESTLRDWATRTDKRY
jgi:hypothetical protein